MAAPTGFELALARESMRRRRTDYRFDYWTYLGWTVLSFHLYSYYGMYRLIQRRAEHGQRRLAFLSTLWHVLDARAQERGLRADVAEGMDNLSRIYAQIDAYELAHRREAALYVALRIAGLVLFMPIAWIIGTITNEFLNKDLRFLDEWESSYFANAEWVLQRLGYPVTIPPRTRPVPERNTLTYFLLSVVTLGLFSIFWRYVTIMDGNGHFDDDDAAEDSILAALDVHPAAVTDFAPPPTSGTAPPPGI